MLISYEHNRSESNISIVGNRWIVKKDEHGRRRTPPMSTQSDQTSTNGHLPACPGVRIRAKLLTIPIAAAHPVGGAGPGETISADHRYHNMLARQRHDFIVDVIRRTGSVRVRDLAEELDVSEMTVRRDLDQLAAQRLIEKVHGGATRVGDMSSYEPGFDAKQRRQRSEKDAIAHRALAFVQPNSAIGLTAGTTTWRFAGGLRKIANLTVVTNAPSIAQSLYQAADPDISVVLTGGIRTPSDALVGPIATEALSKLHIDTLFMGVHGMDDGLGYSTPNLAEAEVNRAFIASARRVVVLADHTKWAMRGLAQIAPLHAADVLVSDDSLSPGARDAFERAGTEVVLASVRGVAEHAS